MLEIPAYVLVSVINIEILRLSLLYETTIINSMFNIILIPCYYFINDRNQFREIDLKNCALYFFIEIKSMLRKKVDE